MNKFDLKDITLVPDVLSDISSRSEIDIIIDGTLPLIAAPMDMVIDSNTANVFSSKNMLVCLPRGVESNNSEHFTSMGLDETIEAYNNKTLPKKLLIDVANGHMRKLYDISKLIKENTDTILMVGNIANPKTYKMYAEIGVDYIRCAIGTGSACLTSVHTGVHYPIGSLISEISSIRNRLSLSTKIVADGGFRTYSDIIKCLALGADYVMLGGVLSKSMESCSPKYIKKLGEYVPYSGEIGEEVYTYYRGMSTKEVQKSWNRKHLKTAEGISFYQKVEYTMDSWLENFQDYLKSSMSYCNAKNLKDFRKSKYILITDNAQKRFEK